VQVDIKRVLAYSTISQIGYMFLGLGVGAWGAGVFHFMTHAFFKALLFLAAGVVILAMHHEQNMFHMGGLRKRMPFAFWTFLIGGSSLAALPLVTAGFYSKDLILEGAWAMGGTGYVLWGAGMLGAFLTGLYTFRAIFIVFFGEMRHEPVWWPDWRIKLPLVLLAALSIVGGFVEMPRTLGGFSAFAELLRPALPASTHEEIAVGTEAALQLSAVVVSLLGIYLAYIYYLRSPERAAGMSTGEWGSLFSRWWRAGWGFDWLYDLLFVRPLSWVANTNRADVVNLFWDGVGQLNALLNRGLAATESGIVRWYAAGVAVGAVLLIAIGAFAR
ncbi:MAG TPA: proton-conducting transporter membrane subunit, partial [Chloroflexota bacterium]